MSAVPSRRRIALPAWALMLLFAVCYGCIIGFSFPLSDDVLFPSIYRTFVRRFGSEPYGYLRWMWHQWYCDNSRVANYLAPLLLHNFTRGALGVMCGFMCLIMTAMTVRLSRLRGSLALLQTVLAALLAFTLPWADAGWLADVSLNYVWGTAVVLLFLGTFFYGRARRMRPFLWLLLPFSLLAGAWHESLGDSVCVALAWWCIAGGRWRRLAPPKRAMALAFAAGALLASLSHGIISRALEGSIPDDPAWLIFLKSDFYVIPLLLLLIPQIAKGRLLKVMSGITGFWTVAALTAALFSAFGGIVGRSGWFAQVFALIAICRLLRPLLRGCAPGLAKALCAWAIVALSAANFTLAVKWQRILAAECREVMARYVTADDGVVFARFTSDEELPFWLLRRVRGVPDGNDYHIQRALRYTYSLTDAPFIVLPPEAQDMQWGAEAPDSVATSRGYLTRRAILTDSRGETVLHGVTVKVDTVMLQGRPWHYVRHCDRDWGDRPAEWTLQSLGLPDLWK